MCFTLTCYRTFSPVNQAPTSAMNARNGQSMSREFEIWSDLRFANWFGLCWEVPEEQQSSSSNAWPTSWAKILRSNTVLPWDGGHVFWAFPSSCEQWCTCEGHVHTPVTLAVMQWNRRVSRRTVPKSVLNRNTLKSHSNQILFSFSSDKDRRTDSQIRRKTQRSPAGNQTQGLANSSRTL